mmetsp:Transcript_25183/g.30736  ORF Transcript_25183/g.30736 Transcript_25183/m.30736 type:complete len:509 (+) Transcript_25183:439-1965(+)
MDKRIGIVASEAYFPQRYVSHSALEEYDGVKAGKYSVGLGCERMAFAGPEEDINSICLSALDSLMEKYGLSYKDIGRLEVGTETIVDKSKSTKTTLMQLFKDSGNSDVLGVTNINACYGGTAAIFNTIDWMESSAWETDGRYGVVICGDIAVYEPGPARPTGGAGAVALLIGPNAPLVFENKLRSSHFEDVYDFYKPDLNCEYPYVDGKLSNECYLRAVDHCYQGYSSKFQQLFGKEISIDSGDCNHFLLHQPYTKLVQKSFARYLYNDFLSTRNLEKYPTLEEFRNISAQDSYSNRDLEKECMRLADRGYQQQVFPYTYAGRQLGNSYTGSLWFALLCLIAESAESNKGFIGDRALMFSYGSGLAATMFSCIIDGSLKEQAEKCDLYNRIENRREATAEEFTETLEKRRLSHLPENDENAFVGSGDASNIPPGAFYLTSVDEKKRRVYERSPVMSQQEFNVATAAGGSLRSYHTSCRSCNISVRKFSNSSHLNGIRLAQKALRKLVR